MRTWQEGGHLQARKRVLTRVWINWCFLHGLLASCAVGNDRVFCRAPSLGSSDMIPWAASDTPCISSHLLFPIHLPCFPSQIPGMGAQTPTSGPGALRTSFCSLSSASAPSPAPWALPKLLRSRVRVWKGDCLLWGLGGQLLSHHHQRQALRSRGKSTDSRFLQPPSSGPYRSLLKPEIKPVPPAVGAQVLITTPPGNSWEIP